MDGEACNANEGNPISETKSRLEELVKETLYQSSPGPNLNSVPSHGPKETPLNRRKWKCHVRLLGLYNPHKLLSRKQTRGDIWPISQCPDRDKLHKLGEVSDVSTSDSLFELAVVAQQLRGVI